ncbi:MAG: TetR/AcrR family transcriptional regulator [Bacteroidetes bacterium]|nr:MAG: TetR/AcrR family transcriptional regulator [Bacteroidota bacterium]
MAKKEIAPNLQHKERRKRDVESLKARILRAARDLAIRDGWTEVSIRKIASIIEYTPPVIYEHFENKEAILIELETIGFGELKQALLAARAAEPDASHQLGSITRAYWRWAFDQRDLYQVMFNLDGIKSTPRSTASLRDAGTAVSETLRQISLFAGDIDELFFTWWSMCHGFVSLVMSGQIQGMDSRMERNLLSAVDRFAKSLV